MRILIGCWRRAVGDGVQLVTAWLGNPPWNGGRNVKFFHDYRGATQAAWDQASKDGSFSIHGARSRVRSPHRGGLAAASAVIRPAYEREYPNELISAVENHGGLRARALSRRARLASRPKPQELHVLGFLPLSRQNSLGACIRPIVRHRWLPPALMHMPIISGAPVSKLEPSFLARE